MEPVIFVVSVKRPIEQNVFEFLLSQCDKKKQEKIRKQRIKQNADNMLIGDILAKTAIKKVFGIEIKNQKFAYGEHGKPYLLNYPDIHFNVSHSGYMVLCAVCDKPLGADVQKIVDYKENVAKRVCSRQELEKIESCENRAEEFAKIWTQKEAYLKCIGTGILSFNLKNVLLNTDKNFKTEVFGEYVVTVVW